MRRLQRLLYRPGQAISLCSGQPRRQRHPLRHQHRRLCRRRYREHRRLAMSRLQQQRRPSSRVHHLSNAQRRDPRKLSPLRYLHLHQRRYRGNLRFAMKQQQHRQQHCRQRSRTRRLCNDDLRRCRLRLLRKRHLPRSRYRGNLLLAMRLPPRRRWLRRIRRLYSGQPRDQKRRLWQQHLRFVMRWHPHRQPRHQPRRRVCPLCSDRRRRQPHLRRRLCRGDL